MNCPLAKFASMVKWISRQASNLLLGVRISLEALVVTFNLSLVIARSESDVAI